MKQYVHTWRDGFLWMRGLGAGVALGFLLTKSSDYALGAGSPVVPVTVAALVFFVGTFGTRLLSSDTDDE